VRLPFRAKLSRAYINDGASAAGQLNQTVA